MSFKVDMHVHTLHSGDNDAMPEEMVEEAINRGLHGITFTEHYSYEASDYFEALRDRYSNRIKLFRGFEISAAEGHLLVFGLNTDRLSLSGATASDLLRAATEHGGVVIPSHPYRRGSSLGELVKGLSGFVALEGYNGCNLHSMNMMAIDAASSLGLPYTGGSDAHDPSEVGSCYTEFDVEVTEENFIEALRAGSYTGHDTRKISRLAFPIT